MACRANSDLFFLADEKFDFDVSLSPASSEGDEDEDEVFVGPVRHKESCVSVAVDARLEGSDTRGSWSPLTGDQLEAVCQEAHRLADRLQNSEPSRPHGEDDEATNMTADVTTDGEEFVQDSEAKLGVLGQTASALVPIKRQTFLVQDSPLKQLPTAVQRRLLRASSANAASSTHPANASSSTRPANRASSTRHSSANTSLLTRPAASTRLGVSSPMAGTKTQPRTGLRGKGTLGVGIVLPSRPAVRTTSCSAGKSKVEKTRMKPPGKAVGGQKRSPASRPFSKAESSEDLLSDISSDSLNSSVLGKRPLAPPTKSAARNLSGVKAPFLQNRRVTDTRNTSSSSSSMSSFNSSISLSPARGKLNSSSASIGPAPSSISRPVNPTRRRHSILDSTAEPASSTASRRSLSAQVRKPHEMERLKTTRSTPLKRAEVTPHQLTPSTKGVVPGTTSARLQVGSKIKPKPEAQVPPTPSGGVGGLPHGDDVSKTMKPKRLMSAPSVDRLPQKPSGAPLTPSSGSGRSLQGKARRPSALPTPVKRRMSSIPVATPTNQNRPMGPPPSPESDPAPSSALVKRERGCSPAPTGVQEVEPVDTPDIQPFCLEEEEEPPDTLPSSPPQQDQSERRDPGAQSQGESEPNRNLIELETSEESKKTAEVLLLDLPAPTLQPQEKLLIDLTNTPDQMRTGNKTCTSTQLIDLSSPLIKWSPEDKNENCAPLINLSF